MCENKNLFSSKSNHSTSTKVHKWRFIVSLRSKPLRFRVPMALSPVLSHLLQLKMLMRQWSSVYISVPWSWEERVSSLPPKTKQPLLSTPSYMEIRLISVIFWKSLGKKPRTAQSACASSGRAPREFQKFKFQNFILSGISNLCENLRQRKFPTIQYIKHQHL